MNTPNSVSRAPIVVGMVGVRFNDLHHSALLAAMSAAVLDHRDLILICDENFQKDGGAIDPEKILAEIVAAPSRTERSKQPSFSGEELRKFVTLMRHDLPEPVFHEPFVPDFKSRDKYALQKQFHGRKFPRRAGGKRFNRGPFYRSVA